MMDGQLMMSWLYHNIMQGILPSPPQNTSIWDLHMLHGTVLRMESGWYGKSQTYKVIKV
ncbi:hypothetical protein D3C86_109770 [compost metagenome]